MQPAATPQETLSPGPQAPAQWRLFAILAACAVLVLGLLIAAIGIGAYLLTRAGPQPGAAQGAPVQPVPAGAPGPAGQPMPRVPPGQPAAAPAAGPGTFLSGHVYDTDTGKAVILAYVAVLQPGTDPASDWGKQKGSLLAIGGTTDATGSFETKEPVAKGAVYPVLVFRQDSNVITQYVNIPAGAPDVMDIGTFRLKISHGQGATPASGAAPAASALSRYSDPQGRFTIDYPNAWKLETSDGRDGSLLLIHNLPSLAAVDVWTTSFTGGAQDAATQYEAAYRDQYPTAKQLQGGATRIGGRTAYYVYLTETITESGKSPVDIYAIHVYVPDGRRLYVVDGGTLNRGTHVRDDFPTILQIIQSFQLR